MRTRVFLFWIGAFFVVSLAGVNAVQPDLTSWFLNATSFNKAVTAIRMAKPDYLGGNSLETMTCRSWDGKGPHPAMFNGVWLLTKYDAKHRIALAEGTTDQCSAAVFLASRPPVAFSEADLSRFRTARGLHVGSAYGQVLTTYGGKRVPHPPARLVLGYTASAYGHSVKIGNTLVKLPEVVTVVIEGGRVSSISIYVDESPLF